MLGSLTQRWKHRYLKGMQFQAWMGYLFVLDLMVCELIEYKTNL